MSIRASENSKLVYLITGGSSGLGKAAAIGLLKSGWKVAVLDIQSPVDEYLAKFENNALFIKADVSSEKDVSNALAIVKEKFGKINGIVNCAGVFAAGSIYDSKNKNPHSLELFTKIIQVNLIGTFNVTRLAIPLILGNEPNNDGERGIVINTSSITGLDGAPGNIAYSVSKAAVAGMTKPLAKELSDLGIRVVDIAPGLFETPLTEGVALGTLQYVFPKRAGRPEEFAELVKAIINLPVLNGTTIRLDSAQTI
ncbi:3-hydroxyacyl-CoA dehydrogenase type-2-like [Cylas formicarius]|uniref:3-hydroxyacyl-CoA dehydrogenase type-2-like n=1 Tax=Cylas formicarius TaxID=197179 RepID=UPI002958B0FC|nr:3-hydroxyacyl-CoA dehydrogenase type-2-like [Cylas formicarius]